MAPGSKHDTAAKQLAQAEIHVKELEDLEDFYFEGDRDLKMAAAAGKVAECVDRALAARCSATQAMKTQGLFLKGRALSFVRGQETQAEELLSQAVRLDSKLLAAWNALGEVHWNTQSYQRARECFENAIEFCGANAVSLRNLSMVLRAVDGESNATEDDMVARQRSANFTEALDKAKEAVALDAGDPQNWETLGNAYFGDFFVNARRPDELSRALIAYGKAEAAYTKLGKSNPSLHLNRGIAAGYMEEYDLAIHSFRQAQKSGAASAAKEGQKVMELVQHVAGFTNRKGDMKAKQLKELVEDFKQGGESYRSLRDVRMNAGSAKTPLLAKVVSIVDRQGELPMIMVCCDALGDFFALSLYNAQSSKVADAVTPMRSFIHIQQSKFREVCVNAKHKTWSYPCIRVAHPGDISVVGSGSLEAAAVLSKFTAVALPREPQAIDAAVGRVLEDLSCTSSEQSEADVTQIPGQVDPMQQQWIAEEDAKTKKLEAQARAKARTKPKVKAWSDKNDKASDKVDADNLQLEPFSAVGDIYDSECDTEMETATGCESSLGNDHTGSRRSSVSGFEQDHESCSTGGESKPSHEREENTLSLIQLQSLRLRCEDTLNLRDSCSDTELETNTGSESGLDNNQVMSRGTSEICVDNDNAPDLQTLPMSSELLSCLTPDNDGTVEKDKIEDILEAAPRKPSETRWSEMEDDSDDEYLPKEVLASRSPTNFPLTISLFDALVR